MGFFLASVKKSSSSLIFWGAFEDASKVRSSSSGCDSKDVREDGFGLMDGLADVGAFIEDFFSDFLLNANKSSKSSSTLEMNNNYHE